MERIITLNNFKKLNIASAISLAILAVPAQAVVQIKDDVQLTDETYSEAVQWTPGTAGNALELNNVTVDTAVTGHAGVLVKTANGNDISVNDSNIKGGEKGYSLRFDQVTDSNIMIDKTDLSTNGGDSYTYKTDLLSNSHLTFKDSTLTGGKRGISLGNIENGSVITLDNTKVKEVSSIGTMISSLTDSALNILNGSEVTGDTYGVNISKAENGSVITVDNSNVQGVKGTGIYVPALTDSTLNILNDSNITGGDYGVYITQATGSGINVDKSTISGGKSGIVTTLNGGSSLNVKDSTISGKNRGLNATVNDSKVAIDNSTFTGNVGISFSGNDSDIALSNSQTSGFTLGGGNMQLDITGSDIGSFLVSGQGATESNPRGNNQVNVESSKLTALQMAFGGLWGGRNTLNLVNSEIISAEEGGDAIYIQDTYNNTVNVKDSIIKGNILNGVMYNVSTEPTNNTINIDNSHVEGSIKTFTENPDGTPNPDHPGLGSTINMGNNTTWVAKGESNAENLNITDSTVDIQDAIVGADNWHSENTNVLINSESQLNIDTGSGDMNIKIQSDGKELETAGKDIINIKNGDMDIQADDVDLGGYKYKLVNKDGKWVLEKLEATDWTEIEEGTNGGDNWVELEDGSLVVLSNSANAVLSSLAATQASWNSQTGAVYERLNSRMEQDEGSVWGTYYGSEWAGEAGLSSTFNQKINGLAIGADKTLPLKDGLVTMGVAVMHDNSHLSGFDEKGSGGSMNSTAVHAYGRLAMDNGLFFKGTASAGSASSKLNANSSDGSVSKGDYKQNLFGLTGQAGYRYQVTPEVYVAPYAQMNGYTASATNFSLDNGMKVNSDRYWSARGELGVEAGVNTSIAGIAVTPHVMAAAGHEFVKNNDVHLNGAGTAFNNTVDGSGYKFGAGVETQMTKNLSAGVNVNYSRSEDVEQRFGVNAGVRYSF
ncbi:outer membrane protein [Buttiauxella ferragutiae ATCC 51602]|uniref:Outer membrane protein n=1 Tax=Buttiauxella ferragutiae ATCC 51602 TaxID=1354252 RepID=A0ABX2W6X2_9ENTR|nr:autotransporter outer membrane beta-barrel domain-containing protein [Buttiauxella ferragutiae]OAT26703.1 outer membrane protein [Buttiauxella ferragutiae ATCC 51602]